MKKSSVWLGVLLATLLVIGALAAMTVASSMSGNNDAHASEAEINLEALTQAYTDHVKSESKDLTAFEQRVNRPDIYDGPDYVRVTMDDKGTVIGYVDDNQAPGYQESDTTVFNLEAEKETESIVASDRHHHYYRSPSSMIFNYLLISHMLSSQHRYYGGRYYSAPATARYMPSGYHQRLKASRSSSNSARSGSYGSRRTSGGSSGFGK